MTIVPFPNTSQDLRSELARDLLIFQLCASAPACRSEITSLCKRRAREIQKVLEAQKTDTNLLKPHN